MVSAWGHLSLVTHPVLRQMGSLNQHPILLPLSFLLLPQEERLGMMLPLDVSGDQAQQPWTAREEDGFRQAAVADSWRFLL